MPRYMKTRRYETARDFIEDLFYLRARPRGRTIPLGRLDERLVVGLPLVELPRADGKRDWRCSGPFCFGLGLVDCGGLSTKDISVVLSPPLADRCNLSGC
jgi:hypothetical protein